MRFMKFVCSCLASVFALSVIFSKISLDKVYAATLPSDGYMMTAQESLSLFGQSFDVSYMDSTGVYHTASAVYQGTSDISDTNGYVDDAGYITVGRTFLFYRMYDGAHALNAQPQNVTVKLKPQYSIFDTEYIYTAIAVMSDANDATTNISAYNSPVWKWIWNGNIVNFDSVSIADNNVLPHLNFTSRGQYSYDFVRAYMTSQSTTSGSSIEATFDHVRTWSSGYADVFIMVGCPYISSGASGASGTLDTTGSVTTSTTQNININVDVDLSTTNTLLGGVIAAIQNVASAILNGLANLFIPTQEQLEDWKDDMQQLLADHLGGLYEAVDYITDFLQNLTTAEPATYIHINQMTVPIKYIRVGSSPLVLDTYNFVLGPYDVNLKYDDLHLIYDGLALIVDFLATWYFLNMCRNKLEIILNPDSEKIEE